TRQPASDDERESDQYQGQPEKRQEARPQARQLRRAAAADFLDFIGHSIRQGHSRGHWSTKQAFRTGFFDLDLILYCELIDPTCESAVNSQSVMHPARIK